jgi:hypothetical protein
MTGDDFRIELAKLLCGFFSTLAIASVIYGLWHLFH